MWITGIQNENGVFGTITPYHFLEGIQVNAGISEINLGVLMFPSLDTLFISVGIAAYVSAHAYVLLVLKAPAARRAYESSRQGH